MNGDNNVPTEMPTNDWWKLAESALGTVERVQLARAGVPAQGGYQSSNVKNFPPGGGGLNPQAASVPGATIRLPGGIALTQGPVLIVLLAVLAVLLIARARA